MRSQSDKKRYTSMAPGIHHCINCMIQASLGRNEPSQQNMNIQLVIRQLIKYVNGLVFINSYTHAQIDITSKSTINKIVELEH